MDKRRKLKELRGYLNFEKDVQLADFFLDIKPNTLHNWIKINSYDAELIYKSVIF